MPDDLIETTLTIPVVLTPQAQRILDRLISTTDPASLGNTDLLQAALVVTISVMRAYIAHLRSVTH